MKPVISIEKFTAELSAVLDKLLNEQEAKIRETAALCGEALINGGVIQVFGSGHSVGFGLEMLGRPGSLVPVNNIELADFVKMGDTTYEDFKDQDNQFERRPGIADQLYKMHHVNPADIFIIISNSGINGVVIDLALYAKEKGHKVIVVTSWQHTSNEDSRHPSGKKLYQIGDVVIDNCGPQGDALIETGELEKICSISSITGAFIAQCIGVETCEYMIAKNQEPPVLWSKDMDGYQEHNQDLLSKYQGRI